MSHKLEPIQPKLLLDIIMSIRKPLPPPLKRFDDRRYRKPKHPHRFIDCSETQE